jgi:beta-mannosidase
MEGALNPKHWSVHGNSPPDSCEQSFGNENTCSGVNVMAERNYPCDTHIIAYFGNVTNLDAVGEVAFQEQMYHCLMGQALWMKGEIEARRSTNSYGLLIWQMNENWPTGGWGCIEWGPSDKSNTQVVGGRWKPLMHLLESCLFRDVMAACGTDNRCYVRNDGRETLSAQLSFEAWNIGSAKPTQTLSYSIVLKADAICKQNH